MAGTEAVSKFIEANQIPAANSNKKQSELSMDDFFQLMVAQLQNQDMFQPMDNTQFLNQMAQFSMVSALSDMNELTSVTYSMSLIGKYATVAYMNDSNQFMSDQGVVEGVNLFNGGAKVVINGNEYDLANVMTVNEPEKTGTLPLIEHAGLIGRTAVVLHTTDSGAETVKGVIEMLRIVDGEVKAYINGRAFKLSEIQTLSADDASADTSNGA